MSQKERILGLEGSQVSEGIYDGQGRSSGMDIWRSCG